MSSSWSLSLLADESPVLQEAYRSLRMDRRRGRIAIARCRASVGTMAFDASSLEAILVDTIGMTPERCAACVAGLREFDSNANAEVRLGPGD